MSGKQWKANSHISRGDVGGGAGSTAAPQVFVIQLSVCFLDSPLHNSSSSSRLAAVLPGLQVTNLHKRHPLRLSVVKSRWEEKQELFANSSASSSKHHGTTQRITRTNQRTTSCGAKTKVKQKKKKRTRSDMRCMWRENDTCAFP